MENCQKPYKLGDKFTERNKKGKDNWAPRKAKSEQYGTIISYAHPKRAERVMHCAEMLNFISTKNHGLKLYQAYFCKAKQCPLCQWRKSMKYNALLNRMMELNIQKHPTARYVFLTLTVKNVTGAELGQQITELHKGFKRLFKRKQVADYLIGWLRGTEVTYNNQTDTYHAHIHVLLCVTQAYFKSGYINQNKWTELWKNAMRLDYTPVVNVKIVKAKDGQGLQHAILETAKYPIKPFNRKGLTDNQYADVVLTFEDQLFKKRQLAFGLEFKDLKKLVDDEFAAKQGDELIQTSLDDVGEKYTDDMDIVSARWFANLKYYKVKSIKSKAEFDAEHDIKKQS